MTYLLTQKQFHLEQLPVLSDLLVVEGEIFYERNDLANATTCFRRALQILVHLEESQKKVLSFDRI